MYQKLADGEWKPALGASKTAKTLQLKLDLSPFMTKQQAQDRLNQFSEKALALLEVIQQRFVFGQRLVCAAGWLDELKYKDGRQVDLTRYSKLLAVAQATCKAGDNPKLESVALELGWGTKYANSNRQSRYQVNMAVFLRSKDIAKSWFTNGRVGSRFHPAPPHQTVRAVFPHTAFRCSSLQSMHK